MGEQDALPSTQDAQIESAVAQASLPVVAAAPEEKETVVIEAVPAVAEAVTITPQVKNGKVIDALRQFLPREVMVEVIERVSEAAVAQAVVEPAPVAKVFALARRKMKLVQSTPMVTANSATIDAPISTPIIASIAPPVPAPVPAIPQASPRVLSLVGHLPPVLPLSHRTIHTLGHSEHSSNFSRRLSNVLMPDAIGRWMQHPILPILSGIAFGLLVLWWLLGQ